MNIDIKFYLKLLLRRLPLLLPIVMICTLVGAVMAVRAPTSFETSARLLVEDPEIPGSLAASTVQTDPGATIEIIRQRLLTRANLLDIATDFDVFTDRSEVPPDEIVERMQRATRISSGRGSPVIVTVSFTARNGVIAANVVNEYVTRIVNANAELRTGRAEDTLEFFEQEVTRLAAELDTQSARITTFQRDNADALPGDQQFRMSRLELLQERVASAERQRNALVDQRARIEQIFEENGGMIPVEGEELTRDQQMLRQLEVQLADALLVYSETSPRVQVLRTRVERLRERIDGDVGPAMSADGGENGERSAGEAMLEAQLAQIDSEIETIDTFLVETNARMAELEDAIARTPETAIILRGLERDYTNIRAQYDTAVSRLAQASTGERIEVTARGQRISIIEPASVPQRPTNSSTVRTIIMGFAAGLGLAAGLFALLEILNRSIRRPVEITNGLGITPLATIPLMETPRRRALRRGAYAASFVVILVGLPVALWAVDTFFMPLDQLAERVLSQVGLT
jgi:polysaccharide chain length determinant protein (PEP-CTERM system associated)